MKIPASFLKQETWSHKPHPVKITRADSSHATSVLFSKYVTPFPQQEQISHVIKSKWKVPTPASQRNLKTKRSMNLFNRTVDKVHPQPFGWMVTCRSVSDNICSDINEIDIIPMISFSIVDDNYELVAACTLQMSNLILELVFLQ